MTVVEKDAKFPLLKNSSDSVFDCIGLLLKLAIFEKSSIFVSEDFEQNRYNTVTSISFILGHLSLKTNPCVSKCTILHLVDVVMIKNCCNEGYAM
jgi:hypothetical protein